MNDRCGIQESQNATRQLERLAAQRRIYSIAKRIGGMQMAASLLSPMVWPALALTCPSAHIWAALYGLTLPVIDVVFWDPWKQQLQKTAAAIQEAFDCDVLELGPHPLKACGAETDVVKQRSDEYNARFPNFRGLRDWYPSCTCELSLSLARLVCQRTNLWFDVRTRDAYTRLIRFVLFILVVVSVTVGIFAKFPMDTWLLATIVPIQPAVLWSAREWRRQRDTTVEMKRLRECLDKTWQRAIAGELDDGQLTRESRLFQDALYDHRKQNSQVFDFVFNCLQGRLQIGSDRTTQEMVEEAKTALEKRAG